MEATKKERFQDLGELIMQTEIFMKASFARMRWKDKESTSQKALIHMLERYLDITNAFKLFLRVPDILLNFAGK